MKIKTSITLSEDLLREVDQLAKGTSRSDVIECAVREYLVSRAHAIRDARDIEILNKHADEYTELIDDVLRFQAPFELEGE